MGQGWFESDEEYQRRIARESNEAVIERLTGSAPSQGWLESESDYGARLSDEANEATIESLEGDAPSQGWLESSADYRQRISNEANEATISAVHGEAPSQGWLESTDDYHRRTRQDAHEATLESHTGERPSQGFLESSKDFRHRVSREAREASASNQTSSARPAALVEHPLSQERPNGGVEIRRVERGSMGDSRRLLEDGERFFDRKCYEAADRQFSTAIQQSPKDVEPYLWRAITRSRMRRFDDALTDIAHAMDLRKKPSPRILYIRGDIYEDMSKFVSAIKDYTAALHLENESDVSTLQRRARCFYKLGRFEEAADDYERLLDLEPDQIEHLERKAAMLHHAGRSKKAVREIDRRMHWFGEKLGLQQLRREILEEQSLWDKLFG